MKLYKYFGTISSMEGVGQTAKSIILQELHNDEKAPIYLNIYGTLAKYIYDIESTDAEERYLNANWYYDAILCLRYIEIPSTSSTVPAKIIAQDKHDNQLMIFGPEAYIETSSPKPMDKEALNDWLDWKYDHI